MSLFSGLYPRKSAPDSRGGLLLPSYRSGQPEWTDWDTDKAITDGFKASVWVYRCLTALSDMVSSLPWYVERRVGDEWERVEGHPVETLLEAPNPYFGRRELIERVILHLGLAGEAYLLKAFVRGVPVELWPVDPRGMSPIPNKATWIEGYKYEWDGVMESFTPEQIAQILLPDPATPYRGLSPLKAAAKAVDTDVEAGNWRKLTLQNHLGVEGILAFPSPLTKPQWEEARQAMRSRHTGPEAERFLILSGGATFASTSMSARDSQLTESNALTREEICIALGFPPSYFGLGDPTYSNFATAEKVAWRNTAIPAAHRLSSALSRSLLPHFGGESGLWLRFDTSNVEALKADLVAKSQVYATLVQNRVEPEAAAELLELDLDAEDFTEPAPNPFALPPDDEPQDAATEPDNEGMPQPEAAQGNAKARPADRRRALSELDLIATKLKPEMAALFLRASRVLERGIPAEELVELLGRVGLDDLLKRIDFSKLAEALRELAKPLIEAFSQAGKVAASQISRNIGRTVGWDEQQAALWADERSRKLSEMIVASNAKAARRFFERADSLWTPIVGPRNVAKFLKRAALLTPQQLAQAEAHARDLLRSGRTAAEVSRAITDWMDSALLERAEVIAEGEAIGATRAAQVEAAKQAQQTGVLTNGWKEWVTEGEFGGNPCPICAPMDQQMVRLEEQFFVPGLGPNGQFVNHPGPTEVHPNCHCGLLIIEQKVTEP